MLLLGILEMVGKLLLLSRISRNFEKFESNLKKPKKKTKKSRNHLKLSIPKMNFEYEEFA